MISSIQILKWNTAEIKLVVVAMQEPPPFSILTFSKVSGSLVTCLCSPPRLDATCLYSHKIPSSSLLSLHKLHCAWESKGQNWSGKQTLPAHKTFSSPSHELNMHEHCVLGGKIRDALRVNHEGTGNVKGQVFACQDLWLNLASVCWFMPICFLSHSIRGHSPYYRWGN